MRVLVPKLVFCCLLALCLPQPGIGADQDCALPLAKLAHASWDNSHGLSVNFVNDIAVTGDGSVWAGTEDSLSRFDGNEFHATAIGDPDEDQFIDSLAISPDGRSLLIGSYYQGVFELEDAVGEAGYSFSPSLLRAASSATPSDDGGPEAHAGLYALDVQEQEVIRNIAGRVSAVHRGESGAVWIGSADGQLWRLDPAENSLSSLPTTGRFLIEAIFERGTDELWVGTRGGLYRVVPSTASVAQVLEVAATDIEPGPDGNSMWFATLDRGVGRFCYDKVDWLDEADGLFSNHINALDFAPDGSVWLGSTDHGIGRLWSTPIKSITPADGLPAAPVLPVLADADGEVWVGTFGAGLVRIEDGEPVFALAADIDPTVLSLAKAGASALWVGTRHGLYLVKNGVVDQHYPVDDSLLHPTVSAITPHGNLVYIGTRNGIGVLEDGELRTINTGGLLKDAVFSIFPESESTLLIGARSGGVIRMRDDGTVEPVAYGDRFLEAAVYDFHRSSDGTLWIGSSIGLFRWKDDQLDQLSKFNGGLVENNVYSLSEDSSGGFWINGNQGIYRLEKREVEGFFEQGGENVEILHFTDRDGMPRSETNGGFQPTVASTADDLLLYPTSSGLAIVDPPTLLSARKPPRPRIENLLVDQRENVRLADSIAPSPKLLEVSFSAIEFSSPRDVTFGYRLVGLGKTWFETKERSVGFHRLPAGDYVFELRARFKRGPWSQVISRPMEIERHWSRHPLTIAVAVAFLALACYRAAMVFQQRRAMRRRRLLDHQNLQAMGSLASGIAHDFNNLLTPIMMAAESIEQCQRNSTQARQDAGFILDAADTGKAMAQELSRYGRREKSSTTHSLDLGPELQEAMTFLKRLVPHGIRIEVDVSQSMGRCAISRHYLRQILMNLVVNSVQAMPDGGKLTITCAREGTMAGEARLEVSDTGEGMDTATVARIFDRFFTTRESGSGIGLMVIKSYVEEAGGRIAVQSGVGEGTRFTIWLPVFDDAVTTSSGADV